MGILGWRQIDLARVLFGSLGLSGRVRMQLLTVTVEKLQVRY